MTVDNFDLLENQDELELISKQMKAAAIVDQAALNQGIFSDKGA